MEDEQVIFETVELRVIRAVEHALKQSKLEFRLDLPRATVHTSGPKKPTLRVFVGAADFEVASEKVELALIRFGRVRALLTKPTPVPETAPTSSYLPIIWMSL